MDPLAAAVPKTLFVPIATINKFFKTADTLEDMQIGLLFVLVEGLLYISCKLTNFNVKCNF
jgi:hypothetical protein